MEDSVKEQASATANAGKSGSKLRYPLRSATKSKEEKPAATAAAAAELPNTSASKRGRPASIVSKSVGVLDLSAKDKSGKPPRRLSIPAKTTISHVPKSVGNVSPISEVRAKRLVKSQEKNDTPASDVSKSSSRRKFSVLLSASYWLSQIKLSECAAKHKISLGFFKLAIEAGCEPLQRMRDELKSYARRHNLAELGESVKELFESYNILENFEQLQVSETCSQVPEEGTRSSDDDVHSSSSVTGARKLKPKSLNTETTVQASAVTESAKKLLFKLLQSQNQPRRILLKRIILERGSEDLGIRILQTQDPLQKLLGVAYQRNLRFQASKNRIKIRIRSRGWERKLLVSKVQPTRHLQTKHAKKTKKTWMLLRWKRSV